MRVISGSLKRRNIDAPKGHKTHPMSEKMRGALFNVLGDINGLTVFDAYGGSGAIAFEAISRGAKSVFITEVDKSAAEIVAANIKNLGLADRVELARANSNTWSESNSSAQFDLVIGDPPYDDIKDDQLKTLVQNVKNGGLLILSLPPDYPRFEQEYLKLELDRNYGDGSLVFYRKI
ncbi:MAG TPA: RsmD family RNA methyltransferase [Patescibacteria group bacterium]|nr:RsmD family RNA methyltransferase [Patescibacteria group bacterium]